VLFKSLFLDAKQLLSLGYPWLFFTFFFRRACISPRHHSPLFFVLGSVTLVGLQFAPPG